ncbi:hypothetical protein GCM10007874_62560 [Labrys miyagiensis]|uniref:Uncharacterized protein n=1 Tax=Labrys miyagiensis TaxID=346912 RepID=A0ABQ6CSA0_9HYPH|nr:hypothetical protein [Labrys miyagiensis]GLS23236.1 hypothetical protein GCM10007874_62560 [Labrys miyagiensis]
MAWLGGLVFVATGLALLVWLQRRERTAIWRKRRDIFADCLPLLDAGAITLGRDGFPCLTGRIAGRQIRAELLPDTLTIRRLPQLWLSLTILTPLPATSSLGVLVRPSGSEFYARTPELPLRLDVPAPFPAEAMLRGSGPGASALLPRISKAFAAFLKDARVKEIMLTPRGLRVVHQVAEGQRGAHLLLRQCDFGDARVETTTFLRLYDGLEAIAAAVEPSARPAAARPGLRA